MAERAFLDERGWCRWRCFKRNDAGERVNSECRVPTTRANTAGMAVWLVTGPDEAPSLQPSVDCQGGCGFHGFVTSGEVIGAPGEDPDMGAR